MKTVCTREIVRIDGMAEVARTRLADELFDLHTRIFRGVNREQFEHKVLTPPARWTRIQLLRNEAGQLVGYCAIHLFYMVLWGRTNCVFRAEAGILKAYRGAGTTFQFGFSRAIFYKMKHPLARVFFFCTLVHPSSYHILATRFHKLYPSHSGSTPSRIEAFMFAISDAFGAREACKGIPGVREVGWITIDDDEDAAYWQGSSKPDVKFFLKANPGFQEGMGLVTLVPLSWNNLLSTTLMLMKQRLFRAT